MEEAVVNSIAKAKEHHFVDKESFERRVESE